MVDIRGSTILVTGGTGSFGNRVATYLLRHGPRSIRIFSRDEKKQWEMQQAFPDFHYILGDVRDFPRVKQAMRGVDLVFHAAALKQVPACEQYPWEAFKTNAFGSQNVCEAAMGTGVGAVVALSTDKAVKPVNAMGISKAMMEKLVCAYNRTSCDTVFCCVRYGNVLGTRGSIVPLFRRLIEQGLPLPITLGHMTRFLLTLDESVELVLKAMKEAQGGEVYVRKAPACTVADLARAMTRRYSRLGEDHPLEMKGTRPGEKIHEILVNEYEMQRATESEQYFTIHPEYRRPEGSGAYSPGAEYGSDSAPRVTDMGELGALLDKVDDREPAW